MLKGTDRLTEKVYGFCMEQGLLERGMKVIAGVSGGADSVCLLRMLDEMKEAIAEKDIELKYDDTVLEVIAEKSYDRKSGARDIRRVIRDSVEDKVAAAIIDNPESVITALVITADKEKKEITVSFESAGEKLSDKKEAAASGIDLSK